MNPVQVVEAARPEVGPMPSVERRHLRERLFDVAMRSQGGHEPMAVASPNTRGANALRIGALVLLGAAAVGSLAYSASRETPGATGDSGNADLITSTTVEPIRNTIAAAPRPTVAPTTTMPPVAGSSETPLLLPPERNRLDELTVTRRQLGGSSLLLRASDSTTVSLREVDGVAPVQPNDDEPPTTDAEGVVVTTTIPRQFAGIAVVTPPEDAPTEYDVEVPCGSLTVLDVRDQPTFRPVINSLFDATRLENGTISIALPDGWSLISSGRSTDEFIFGLPVEVGEREVTVTLAQYPDGSIAVAGYDDRQYGPATFLGQPAWIHREVDDPERYDIITMIGTTAISVSTRELALTELEGVVAGLTPGDVDDWVTRFGALPVSPDPDIRTCRDQPEFEVT